MSQIHKPMDTIVIAGGDTPLSRSMSRLLGSTYSVRESSDGADGADVAIFIMSATDQHGSLGECMQFVAGVKQDRATAHIPVVVVAGTAELPEQSHANLLKSGADQILDGTLDLDTIFLTVKNLLSQRDRYRNLYSHSSASDGLTTHPIHGHTSDVQFMSKAITVMKAHYADSEYTLERFVRDLGVSKSYANSKMQSLLGLSIGRFMKNYRLSVARRIIEHSNGDYNVAVVAYDVGFNDPKYFTKCYKQHFGTLPSAAKGS